MNIFIYFQPIIIALLFLLLMIVSIFSFLFISRLHKKHAQDLTEKKEKLESAENLKKIIEMLPNAVFKYKKDESGHIFIVYNEGCRPNQLNLTTDNVYGKSISDLYDEDHVLLATEAIEKAFKGETAEFTDIFDNKIFQNIIKPVFDAQNNIIEVAGYSVDMTEHKRTVDKMQHIAYHDALTDLANRLYFNIRLNEVICENNENEQLALILIDLDNFKKVNDCLGHQSGDALLIEVANRLKAALRRNFDLASRLGGDEFAILLPRINSESDIHEIIERIFCLLRQPIYINNSDVVNDFNVTASIGVAIAPKHAQEAKALLEKADMAMYQAKNNGKNTYVVYSNQ